MASNPNAFVSATQIVTAAEFHEKMPLSSSLPIRAPLTLDDSETDFSSDATLSDTASNSDLEPEPHFASQQDEEEGEECFELDDLSPLVQVPLRVTPFAHLSTKDEDEDEDEDEYEDNEMLSDVRIPENIVVAPIIKTLNVEESSENLHANELTFLENTSSGVSIDEEMRGNGLRVACDGSSIATDSDAMSQCSQDSLNNEEFEKVKVALNELEKVEIIRVDLIENDDAVIQRNWEVDNNTGTTDTVEEISNTCLLESYAEDCSETMMPQQSISVDDLGEQSPQADENIEDSSTILASKATLHDSSADMVEEISNTGLLEFNDEGFTDSMMLEENTIVEFLEFLEEKNPHSGESLSDALAENSEYITKTTQSNAANGSQDVAASHQESESEKLESITEYVVNSKAMLHDSAVGFECNGDACEGNKIQGVEYSEHSDPALLEKWAYLEKGLSETVSSVIQEDGLFCDNHSNENVETLDFGDTVNKEATTELNIVSQESKREGSALDEDMEEYMSVGLEQFREQIAALSILLSSKGSGKNSHEEQTVSSPDGRMNLSKDDVRSQLFYFDSGGESDCNSVTVTYADQSNVIFLKGPASFNFVPDDDAQAGFQHIISEQEKEKIQKIQTISVKFLRLVHRINLSLEDSLVSKVLCRLVADIGRRSNQESVIRSAKILAKKLEEDFQDDLDFSLNILVLGKSGVGKSATINYIFGDMMVMTDAFEPATTSVREISGTIDGVNIRIIDTPGLRSPMKEQAFNRKILSSVKRYMKKFPLDVILYVDRVDIQTTDLNDLPMLRTITSSLGPSIWQHAILTLTHAASTPSDGPTGSPLNYDVFVAQKSYLVQQSIIKAVGNLCQLSPSFMFPVSLVENHPLCGKNISGDSVVPNGVRWRSQLLALCFSLKIISQVSSVSVPCTLFDHWKQIFFQDHSQPMCHLCSCLLQSPAHHLKFSANWN